MDRRTCMECGETIPASFDYCPYCAHRRNAKVRFRANVAICLGLALVVSWMGFSFVLLEGDPYAWTSLQRGNFLISTFALWAISVMGLCFYEGTEETELRERVVSFLEAEE